MFVEVACVGVYLLQSGVSWTHVNYLCWSGARGRVVAVVEFDRI